MAGNNNNRPGGKRPNSPRYSDRYGPGHVNPYLGAQPGQSAFIRDMEERQEAARRQSEENARRQRQQQEAANRQREAEAARRRELEAARAAQEAEEAHRREREVDHRPRAMRDPKTQQRLRQIQERAVREAKSLARGDEADFGDIDFIQQPPDVRLRLTDDGQPLIALETDDGSGSKTVRWVPVVLSEKEMETFFPAFEPVQESKGIEVQEEIRTPKGNMEADIEEQAPQTEEAADDDIVLIPIADNDEDTKSNINAAAAVSVAVAVTELLDSGADVQAEAPEMPEPEPIPEPEPEPEPEPVPVFVPVPQAPPAPARGAGLKAMLDSLPSITVEPEDDGSAAGAALLTAGAVTLAAGVVGAAVSAEDIPEVGLPDAPTTPEIPTVEYDVPDADDADDKAGESSDAEAAGTADDAETQEDDAEDNASAQSVMAAAAAVAAAMAEDTGSEPEESSGEPEEEPTEDDAVGEPAGEESADEEAADGTDEEPVEEESSDEPAEEPAGEDAPDESSEESTEEDVPDEPAEKAVEEDPHDEIAAVPVAEDAPDEAAAEPDDDDDADREDDMILIMPVDEDEQEEKAPREAVSRPKRKRRRSRPTDVQMPEELMAAAAAREETPEPEPTARRTAVATVPFYDDDADYDSGDRMFTRRPRPASSSTLTMHDGAGLPKYIDDDDFVERWLGDEEDEDLASQAKYRRRKIAAFIGAATMILALIGLIAVAKWGVGLLGNLGGSESQKDIYGEYISPIVMSEVPVFETWDAIPQDKLLQSAVFSVLMDNDVTYERDDTGKFIVPSNDIVNAVKELYGAASEDAAQDEEINTQIRNALYGSAGEDVTNEDAYYVDMEDSFHVADNLSGPAPNVTDISKRDNTITLTVEYLEDLETSTGGALYTRQVILTVNEDDTYFVKAIREQQD